MAIYQKIQHIVQQATFYNLTWLIAGPLKTT